MCYANSIITERGDELPQGFACTADGNLPACELCPRSPGYWRNSDPPDVVRFEIPDLDMTGWTEDRTKLITDKKDVRYVIPATLIDGMRCSICRLTTTWISPRGIRCHPSCARNHLRDKARQKAEEAAHPTTEPA